MMYQSSTNPILSGSESLIYLAIYDLCHPWEGINFWVGDSVPLFSCGRDVSYSELRLQLHSYSYSCLLYAWWHHLLLSTLLFSFTKILLHRIFRVLLAIIQDKVTYIYIYIYFCHLDIYWLNVWTWANQRWDTKIGKKCKDVAFVINIYFTIYQYEENN